MRLPVNGIELNVERAGTGQPLLLLHGFTGSTETWTPVLQQLAAESQIVAIDLIGHGRSDAPDSWTRYSFERCVADLLLLLDTLEISGTDLIGYSLGGRVALHLAAAAPERVRGLILESASPGLADPSERRARLESDLALADEIERGGLEAFVHGWERQPLFSSQHTLPATERMFLRSQRLRNDPRGLANSLRGMGAGRQEPLWEHLSGLPMPTLILVGELDRKYCELGQQMATDLPNARLGVVPGAGHTIHLEQPGHFADSVLAFLRAIRLGRTAQRSDAPFARTTNL
jgi:2-succinyl-6-hydroxy-2,4-cyclohexadiene-1-carboxylate synthase